MEFHCGKIVNQENHVAVRTSGTSLNRPVANGLSHPYHLDESIFILRDIMSIFSLLFHFSMKIFSANRIAPDGTPRFAASHLGLFCLPMSNKKDASLKWVKVYNECFEILIVGTDALYSIQ